MKRSSGILMHPTSLPGNNGVGTLGKQAYKFVELLRDAGQKWWQVLPLTPTGFGHSPYQCYSAFAGNPFLIDLDFLEERGWLTKEEATLTISDPKVADFDGVREHLHTVLPSAFNRFLKEGGKEKELFDIFCEEEKDWLDDYTLFRALKDQFDQKSWWEWEEGLKNREKSTLSFYTNLCADQIEYRKFLQYLTISQWKGVKDYANSLGVQIIGDIPIYVSWDSADVWVNPELFLLDEEGYPTHIAGVPPDYFSETGQLWGNPVFNWKKHLETGFSWWKKRVAVTLKNVDIIRLDHFRGFESYWSVPYGEETAINGEWVLGLGRELFNSLTKEFGDLPFIAEDLGVITEEVEALRDDFKLPGMKILQFAFDSDEENDFRPHNYDKNSVVYTGTHDNDTLLGWLNTSSKEDRQFALDYLNGKEETIVWDFIRSAWASTAVLAITTMQDILEQGTESRMNMPGTPTGNWAWRFTWNDVKEKNIKQLKKLTTVYGR
jgi:4-alpha-glucanotransferase